MTSPEPRAEFRNGPVILDLQGETPTAEELELLQHPQLGGVILFARNYRSPEQMAALIETLRRWRPELLILVDQEGGRVQRFQQGLTRLPPMRRLGEAYDLCAEQGLRAAEAAGWIMAAELLALGLDLSLAPVLDLDTGISRVIGDRAFHDQLAALVPIASAFIGGMRQAGMAATGKHFPGHGSVAGDSHELLPVDERSWARIEGYDLQPYAQLLPKGLEAIMPAHLIYPQVDAQPAGFSRFWLQEVLRDRLGFRGLVFSDDLSMSGAEGAGDYPERARAALQAGCDSVLVCNDRAGAVAVLEDLAKRAWPPLTDALAPLRGAEAPDLASLQQTGEWQRARNQLQCLELSERDRGQVPSV